MGCGDCFTFDYGGKMNHTPIPWRVNPTNNGLFICGDAPGHILEVFHGNKVAHKHFPEQEANAAFIIKAVNLHAELVDKLEWVLGTCGPLSPKGSAAVKDAKELLTRAKATP